MPKIRQAIAVLIAAAFCIGFNTFRYPAVWDMVAAAPQASKPAGSNAAVATPAASTESDRDSWSEPAANTHAGAVCKDGVCTMTHPDTPVASMPGSMPSYDQGEPKPAPGLSSEPESKSRDSDWESKPKETESGYKARGSEMEYPSKTPESNSRPKDAESESKPNDPVPGYMSRGLESGYMPKGPGTEYPSKTPESNYRLKGAESGSMPKEAETQPNSYETGSKPEGQNRAVEPANTETSAYPSGLPEETRAERKPAAHLVSDSLSFAAKSPADKAEDRPVATETLVPIERPRSRAKDAAAAAGRSAAAGRRGPGSPSPDFAAKSIADREPDSKNIRHLPPADQGPSFDSASPPPTITPELMRGYRVTSAK